MNAQLETRLRSDAQLRRQADKNQQMMNEWMIAAAVVDRICFIIFSLIFVIGTAVMFVLATAVEHWQSDNFCAHVLSDKLVVCFLTSLCTCSTY